MAKKRKSLPKLKAQCQIVFNAYIRKRDEALPCISCGHFREAYDAGHFFATQGYDGLRFTEDNAHKECVGCNRFNDSHLILYRDNLLAKIGQERFDALYKDAAEYKKNGYKWSRSEIEDKIVEYRTKLKELLK